MDSSPDLTTTLDPTAVFTLFTGRPGHVLTKTITLKDGKLSKDHPWLGKAQVETVRLPLSELPGYLGSLVTNQCLIHGVVKDGLADNEPVTVAVTGSEKKGDINRSRTFFEYPAVPCLSMFDHDPWEDRGVTPEELIQIIASVFPEFAKAATVTALSTSAEIYDLDGQLLSSTPPGFHQYFAALDGSDLPRFGKVLFKRLWLAGYGYSRLGEVGQVLKRGPIDDAVYQPERCDFAAGAVLGEGLEQRRPEPVSRPGGYLDTALLPDLTEEEKAEFERLVKIERERLKPGQEPKRRKHAANEAKRTGEDAEAIYERVVRAAEKSTIDANAKLMVRDTGERMAIWAMVQDGMHGAYIEDPIGDGKTWARLYIDPDQVIVKSFIHGGCDLVVQGLGLSIRGAEPVDLDGKNLADSLQLLAASDNPAGVALSIIRKFASHIPSKFDKDYLLGLISITAPPIAGLSERLDWYVENQRIEAVGLTAISDTVAKRHKYHRGELVKAGRRQTLFPQLVKRPDGVLIIKAPNGVGKTQDFGRPYADLSKAQDDNFAAVCHRISLTHELAKRLGIDDYQDNPGFGNGLAVCVNSIIKDALSPYCQRVETLFIDEISQVLRHIANGTVKEGDRIRVYEALKRMISKAKQVFVADADLGDREIEFLEECRPGERFLIFEFPPNSSHLAVTYRHGPAAVADANAAILSDLGDDLNVIVATDSKAKAATLETLVASELPDKKMLRVDDDTVGEKAQQAFIRDPNGECQKYDLVIHSPTISSGVSIECDHFDVGYGLFFGIIAPSDAVQMIRRARPLTSWHLAFDENHLRHIDDATRAVDGLEQANDETATEFEKFQEGCVAWLNRGRNEFARNMLYLLKESGFNLTPALAGPDDGGATKEAKDQVRAERVQDILDAKDLDWHEARAIERDTATYLEKMAVLKARIKRYLNLDKLTAADVEFYAEGRGITQLKKYELWAGLVLLLSRRHDRVKAQAYERFMAPLGLDRTTGEGSWGREQADAVVDLVMKQPTMLAYLRIVPHSVIYRRPKDSIKFVGNILRFMGLKPAALRKQKGGMRTRRYHLNPATFATVRAYAVRRREAQNESDPFPPLRKLVKRRSGSPRSRRKRHG